MPTAAAAASATCGSSRRSSSIASFISSSASSFIRWIFSGFIFLPMIFPFFFGLTASGVGGGLTQEAGRESIPVEWPLNDSRTNLKVGTPMCFLTANPPTLYENFTKKNPILSSLEKKEQEAGWIAFLLLARGNLRPKIIFLRCRLIKPHFSVVKPNFRPEDFFVHQCHSPPRIAK